MPRNILQGGVYSEESSCGSGDDCSHALLPVEVTAGEETSGVDICDWDADPFDVPLPPDLIENLVVYAWRAQHPDFADSTPLTLEELTMDGQLIDQLGVRVFRVVEGPLENETFLVLGDGPVMRLGEAEGGQGVSSLALSDLDGMVNPSYISATALVRASINPTWGYMPRPTTIWGSTKLRLIIWEIYPCSLTSQDRWASGRWKPIRRR